jgi:hypothetical protein
MKPTAEAVGNDDEPILLLCRRLLPPRVSAQARKKNRKPKNHPGTLGPAALGNAAPAFSLCLRASVVN